MFKFFKRKVKEEVVEQKEEVKNKLHMFDPVQDALFENPSFSLLIQCDHHSNNFLISFKALDYTDESSDTAAILFTQLINGGIKDTLYESIINSADNDSEAKFTEDLVAKCQKLDEYVRESIYKTVAEAITKDTKEAIDPAKVFNIKGIKHEQ